MIVVDINSEQMDADTAQTVTGKRGILPRRNM
jgi:hypothetical protein